MTAAAAPARHPRMSLAAVTRGRVEAPLRLMLYGVPGVGKSTFASAAPNAIFLGAEDGSNNLDVARFPIPASWGDVLDALGELARTKHEYRTLVIDTVDSLEPLCWQVVIGRDSKAKTLEDVGGGYGKGAKAAVDEWRVFMSALERVRAAGITTVLLAHAQVKTFKNPEGPDYDRFSMKMEPQAGSVLAEWCDMQLFAQFEAWVKQERGQRAKGASTDVRIVHTQRTAAFDAKNRYSLPDRLPLGWDDIMSAVRDRRVASPADLRAAINSALEGAAEDIAAKVRAALGRAGDDTTKLAELDNWVRAKVAPKESST